MSATARALGLALAVLLHGACKGQSEEDRVKKVIEQAVEAANQKDAKGVVENALPTFKGPGNKSPEDARRVLAVYFLSGWTRVFVRSLDVTVDGDHAKATVDTVIAQGKPVEKLEDLVPTNGDALVFDVALDKVDGEWKFASASYRRSR